MSKKYDDLKKKLELKECRWAGIDLDLTLAQNSGEPDYTLLEPMEGAKEALEEIQRRGFKITIFTARPYSDYSYIEGWLTHYNIPFRRIICGKPLLAFMVDDKNIEFHGDWKQVIKKIPPMLNKKT